MAEVAEEMIKVTISQTHNIERRFLELEKQFPLVQIAKLVQSDIQQETRKRGWKRIAKTVKRRTVNANLQEVFAGGKDSDIAGYLHDGTKGHFVKPKKKKALKWNEGGASFFSKGHW